MNKLCVHIGMGMTRRIMALLLAMIMVATISPPVTAAGVTDSGKVLLSGFAELPENIREQSVALGVSLGELNLPDTLTATVGAASVDAEPTRTPSRRSQRTAARQLCPPRNSPPSAHRTSLPPKRKS